MGEGMKFTVEESEESEEQENVHSFTGLFVYSLRSDSNKRVNE